jgi:hypothetical protein
MDDVRIRRDAVIEYVRGLGLSPRIVPKHHILFEGIFDNSNRRWSLGHINLLR